VISIHKSGKECSIATNNMGFLMDSPFSSTHYTNIIGLGIRRNGYWEEDHHGQNSSCQRQTLWFANSNRFAYQQAGMSTSGNLDFLWMRTNICINLRWLGSRFSSRVLRLSFKEASQHDLSLNWRIVRWVSGYHDNSSQALGNTGT